MDEPVERNPRRRLVRSQLARILEHPEFQATQKMRDFLCFVVEETLSGKARRLKGFTIAMEVFGRGQEFDAAQDPVVRIQAGRLRRALERYYLVAGMDDPVHIDIPKGGYVPVFTERGKGAGMAGEGQRARPQADVLCEWPGVLVLPFEDLTGREDLSYLATGLATELGMELASTSDLRVMLPGTEWVEVETQGLPPDFIVRGNVRSDGRSIKLVVQLIAARSGELLWSDSSKSVLEESQLIGFQERTAAVIAAHIAGEHGVIFQAMTSAGHAKPAPYASNYAAILKGYAYHQKIDPQAYQQAFEALQQAHARDGSCGLVCTLLALLYVDNIALEFFDLAHTPLEEATQLAREGVRLLPRNQLSRLALARVHLLNNDLAAGLHEIDTLRSQFPDSVLMLDLAGYLAVLMGDRERGERLIRRAMELNPFYRPLARYGLWSNHFHRGRYVEALAEMNWLTGIGFFWDPLCRAATLGQLGQRGACRDAVRQLLGMKPDFSERGHVLIDHYVKFVDLKQKMLDGLAVGGLQLESPAT